MPTNISTNSAPEIEKYGTPASPATARASNVFPVPGGPISTLRCHDGGKTQGDCCGLETEYVPRGPIRRAAMLLFL